MELHLKDLKENDPEEDLKLGAEGVRKRRG